MIMNKLRFVDTSEEKCLTERKKELRIYMRARRGENENRDVKEESLVRNVWNVLSKVYKGAGMPRNAFVYLSFSSEAPTDKLIESLQERGVAVCAPRVIGSEMAAVLIGKDFDFTLSAKGMREPLGEVYEEEIDVAIVPLLAVDMQGNRLGYGGGYYDKYLHQREKTLRIGYAFDFQIVRNVPHEEWDECVDVIITDQRIIYTHVRNK